MNKQETIELLKLLRIIVRLDKNSFIRNNFFLECKYPFSNLVEIEDVISFLEKMIETEYGLTDYDFEGSENYIAEKFFEVEVNRETCGWQFYNIKFKE